MQNFNRREQAEVDSFTVYIDQVPKHVKKKVHLEHVQKIQKILSVTETDR